MAYESKQVEGESLLFPPNHQSDESAKLEVLHLIGRTPSQYGYRQSRWKLSMIAQKIEWLSGKRESTISQLLKRFRIRYKRGRDYVHSPDPDYWPKVDLIEQMRLRTYYQPERFVFLYLDELTFYRQPTVAQCYASAGRTQALAYRSHRSNTSRRLIATLNAISGQVTYRQRARTDIPCLVGFWRDLYETYPDAETIYVVVDNWPVHFHPDVLAPLQEQNFPWQPRLPSNWPTQPSSAPLHENIPIQLLCLPTYASWLNPIEKLWRWLQQDILHMHRMADDWELLKDSINSFLDVFSHGSNPLLRYVGLLPN